MTEPWEGARNADRHAVFASRTICIDCHEPCKPDSWCVCCQPEVTMTAGQVLALFGPTADTRRLLQAGGMRVVIEWADR